MRNEFAKWEIKTSMFSGRKSQVGNCWHKIKAGGKVSRTAESLFQALRFDNPEIQEVIRLKTSSMSAKMAAKSHKAKMVIVPQSPEDLDIMMTVLRLKLLNNPELKIALLGTFSDTIIEDCTNRPGGSGLFWGAALRDGEWVGENHLGKLWMKLRGLLLENSQWGGKRDGYDIDKMGSFGLWFGDATNSAGRSWWNGFSGFKSRRGANAVVRESGRLPSIRAGFAGYS